MKRDHILLYIVSSQKLFYKTVLNCLAITLQIFTVCHQAACPGFPIYCNWFDIITFIAIIVGHFHLFSLGTGHLIIFCASYA
jgi:hypothetical protein